MTTQQTTPQLIKFESADIGYGPGVPQLSNIDFAVNAGERVAVLGPNGGGKTTLFRSIRGEIKTSGGSISVESSVATVHQYDRSRLDLPISALDVVLMGTISKRAWWQRPTRQDRAAALSALEVVGLADSSQKMFGILSGGQRQRVLIARALVRDAQILLLDEPYNGLDEKSSALLDQIIDQLAADGHLLMISTHDLKRAESWDKALLINGRQIAFGSSNSVFTQENLQSAYGQSFFQLDSNKMSILCGHTTSHV